MSNYIPKENIIMEKSKAFALKIIKLYKYLKEIKSEYVISKQILRSGTSIGANIKEAQCSQSRKDFTAKMYIAFKEANETDYWLELLFESDYIGKLEFKKIKTDNEELLKLLASITKTVRQK